MEKIDARKPSTDAQQQLRYQAIRLRKQGRKYKEIAEIIGVQISNHARRTWYDEAPSKGAKTVGTRSTELLL